MSNLDPSSQKRWLPNHTLDPRPFKRRYMISDLKFIGLGFIPSKQKEELKTEYDNLPKDQDVYIIGDIKSPDIKKQIFKEIRYEFKKMLMIYEKISENMNWWKMLYYYSTNKINDEGKKLIDKKFYHCFNFSKKPIRHKKVIKYLEETNDIKDYFKQKRVAIIGRLKNKREELKKLVEKAGGNVVKNFSITTNIVIFGDKIERFDERIHNWMTEKISEKEFLSKIK